MKERESRRGCFKKEKKGTDLKMWTKEEGGSRRRTKKRETKMSDNRGRK